MATKDGSGDPVYYANQLDIFAGRDRKTCRNGIITKRFV
jgi:hypothetical protein